MEKAIERRREGKSVSPHGTSELLVTLFLHMLSTTLVLAAVQARRVITRMISAFGLTELRRVGTTESGGICCDGMLRRERTQDRIRRVSASFVWLGHTSLDQVTILQVSHGSVL